MLTAPTKIVPSLGPKRGVGGSYIRMLGSDLAVFGGRQFVTLIFGEKPAGEQSHRGELWLRADGIEDAVP
jgi:hypothetical protein